MRRLIYQVAVGKPSNLYENCINSVSDYADKYGIDHIVQRKPKLRIKPDPFTNNREGKCGGWKELGYLPIFEKENAFDLMSDYDQIMILDSDIYIRPDSPNIFEEMDCKCAFGAVCEREMNLLPEYVDKIKNYSHMQYGRLHSEKVNFKPNNLGFEFFNMGLIVINCEYFKPYLEGESAEKFLNRMEFKEFVDGVGTYKWSTDQTLLNYFLKKYKIPTRHLGSTWNGLYGAVHNIKDCNFVHFFLRDKLPNNGENFEELKKTI